jgi:putative CRISPR-associated protein (TIGR02619 family)
MCGISILLNTNGQSRSIINKYANLKDKPQQPDPDINHLEQAIEHARASLVKANLQEVAKLSAELNTLFYFYNQQKFPVNDQHFLIHTDTWLGREAVALIEDYLHKNGIHQVRTYGHLRTDDLAEFQMTLTEMVRDLGPELQSYREQGHRIIFNLTAGFKSIQGFLQALAPIYADEVIYIFESQSELFRIPRLPLRLDIDGWIEQNVNSIRCLSLGLPIAQMTNLPDSLVMKIDNQLTLTPWGEAIWQQRKKDLYAQELLPPPYERIVYGPNFKKSTEGLEPDRLSLVNECIDKLARYIATNRQKHLASLGLKQLRGNPMPPSTHECDVWSDKDARRIFLHYEGDKLVLDKLGKALH